MKRRLLTIALVVALCLSLAATAFAADRAEGDVKDGAFTMTRKGDTPLTAQPLQVSTIGLGDDATIRGYYPVTPDETWTITNTAGGESYLLIDVVAYEKVDAGHYACTIMNEAYLRRDGSFAYSNNAYASDEEAALLNLYAGDSVTFNMTDAMQCLGRDASEDVLYGLSLQLNGAGDGEPVARYFYKLAGGGFADVQDTDWFYDAVQWAVEQNITTGTTDTTFSPYQDCSIAQILTFLWRAAGSPEAKAIDGMDANLYYAGAVAWAVEKGMISAEDFTATAPCTRSMAVQFIWQAAGSPKADAASFTDVPVDAEYANAVAWAVKEGVTTGTSDTTFAPDTVCNRGHIVTFLFRAFAD